MADQGNSNSQSSFADQIEPISIDSDSENSTDSASNQEPLGDEDSNSNSAVLPQPAKPSTAEKNIDEITRQELKKLSLDAHGTFMADFDPEKSKREIRKMNRRLYTKGSKRMRLYNEKGQLLEDLDDLCDCLVTDCPGCHFPCPRCGSSKCGTDCRCNRKYTISLIEVEGTDKTYSFPVKMK
ncbi:Arl14 effector [Plakobranchus ocellatus]|uniref:Arl14 effector n=1 Tax=Plakobranchus ocellatus TaxID=259542 RepID=A0AAV4CWX3_9GAST|nr:Arl14 effector [Plakobranchus ocellatus]